MSEIEIAVEQEVSTETRRSIIGGLVAFNDSRAGDATHAEVAIIARRDAEILGGLLAYTNWEWLFIAQLWVSDTVQRQGVGGRILAAAEAEAIRRRCRHAHVDTFSFQAKPFYERNGYTVFGQIEDYPAGHTRYFLQKRNLSQPRAG